MSQRQIDRSIARTLYTKFSQQWRNELRSQNKYGMANSPKRPTFNQWYAMHGRNLGDLKKSTPADVQEYLHANDPWEDMPEYVPVVENKKDEEKRGVYTTSISGGDEDE